MHEFGASLDQFALNFVLILHQNLKIYAGPVLSSGAICDKFSEQY